MACIHSKNDAFRLIVIEKPTRKLTAVIDIVCCTHCGNMRSSAGACHSLHGVKHRSADGLGLNKARCRRVKIYHSLTSSVELSDF